LRTLAGSPRLPFGRRRLTIHSSRPAADETADRIGSKRFNST